MPKSLPLIGAHMSIAGGADRAIDRGVQVGCRTIQIFTKNNNQWRAAPLTPDTIRLFKKKRAAAGIGPIIAHTSYLINMATPDKSLYEKSIHAFRIELQRCKALGIEYLVTHPGATVGATESMGIRRLIKALRRLIRETRGSRVVICVETTAGQGTTLGGAFEQIAAIVNGVPNTRRIGVCLDTCHVFAAGYDISTRKGYREVFREFDRLIGLNRLKVIHVNDSKKPCGSKIDRHEHIGMGQIGESGFHSLMRDSRLRNIPKILETPKGPDMQKDIENLATLQRFYKTPLPR